MLTPFFIQAAALGVLVVSLCASMAWRHRKQWRQQIADQLSDWEFRRHWQPKAFDASRVAPQVQQIRRDPVAAIRHRPRCVGYRQQLMISAREAVLNLAYFQLAKGSALRKTESEAQKRTA